MLAWVTPSMLLDPDYLTSHQQGRRSESHPTAVDFKKHCHDCGTGGRNFHFCSFCSRWRMNTGPWPQEHSSVPTSSKFSVSMPAWADSMCAGNYRCKSAAWSEEKAGNRFTTGENNRDLVTSVLWKDLHAIYTQNGVRSSKSSLKTSGLDWSFVNCSWRWLSHSLFRLYDQGLHGNQLCHLSR